MQIYQLYVSYCYFYEHVFETGVENYGVGLTLYASNFVDIFVAKNYLRLGAFQQPFF